METVKEANDFSFDDILNVEEDFLQQGKQEGIKIGEQSGVEEGFVMGISNGKEIGHEIGFYFGCLVAWKCKLQSSSNKPKRTEKTLLELHDVLLHFPNDPSSDEFGNSLNKCRTLFKKANALMKGPHVGAVENDMSF